MRDGKGAMVASSTGGQVAIRGFLYQILCSLGHVARLAITDEACGDAKLTLEPSAGDLAIAERSVLTVEQFKSRRTGRNWTMSELIERVLPDLLDAARAAPDNTPLQLRFVTDGTCQLGDLCGLLSLVHGMDEAHVLGILETSRHQIRLRGCTLTPMEYASILAEQLRCSSASDPVLLRLLSALEIIDEFDEGLVTARIDSVLSKLVDAREDVEGKRNELVGRLFDAAQQGRTFEIGPFLQQAGLNIVRLAIVARLPAILDRWLDYACRILGYDADADVRPQSLPVDAGPIFVVQGDGGQGKSWSLASLACDLRRRGKLVVLLPASDDLRDVERKVVERVWHSSGFDRPAPISVIAERLAPALQDNDGIWLTVCLDDVQSARLVRDITSENWARLGIRLLLSASPRFGARIAAQCPNARSMTVADFSLRELQRYLRSRELAANQLPDDVTALLRRPILASLYSRIAEHGWMPQNEYALIDRFWKRVTDEVGDQADHPSDKLHVKNLAATVLTPDVQYPWPDREIVRAGLSDEARLRLIDAGLLQSAPCGVSMGHDRLLNWAVAVYLCDAIRTNLMTEADGGAILRRILHVGGDWTKDFASRRLGYTPMDLLWLLLREGATEAAGHLIRALSTHDLRITEEGLYRHMLPTLGAALLPALVAALKEPLIDDIHYLVAREIGRCIIVLFREQGVDVSTTLQCLLDAENRDADTAALIALSAVPAPGLLDRVWAMHLAREAEFEKEPGAAQARSYFEIEESFAALVPSARADPEWIARAIAGQGDRKDQLVYLLLRLPHADAKPLWDRLRPALFDGVTQHRHCLAQALRAFGSAADIDFTITWIRGGGDEIDQAVRFDALVRLSPQRALDALPMVRDSFLTATTGWWLPGLFLATGNAANSALLELFDGSFEGVRDLAIIYQQWQEQLDVLTLRRILDMLANKLADMASETEQRLGGVGHLIRLVGDLYRPELLSVLEEYRGSRLEGLLVDRATRFSLNSDWEREHFRDALFKLGGQGFEQFVLAELRCESEAARTDGLCNALLVATDAISARLREMADGTVAHREHDELVKALAVKGERHSILCLLRASANLPLSTLRYLKALPPLDEDVVGRAIAALSDPDEEIRAGALISLAICGQPSAGAALVSHLQAADPAGADARLAVFALQELGFYESTLNEKLSAMLVDQRSAGRAAGYLLRQSAPEAHTPLLTHLANHPLLCIRDCEENWAFALLRFPDSVDGARAFLRRLMQSTLAFGVEAHIQSEFLKAGDEQAREALYELAWRTTRHGPRTAPTAISALATFDPEAAFEAARRQLREEFDKTTATRLLTIDAIQATRALLREFYLEQNRKDRWIIARLLRWMADPAMLRNILEDFCQSDAPEYRRAACEILGWQTDAMWSDRLREMVRDVEKDVENAALEALQRQRRQAIASELLSQIVLVQADERYRLLVALIEVADPYLLQHRGDPLCWDSIRPQLPCGYELVADLLLRNALKKADEVKDD